MAILYIGLLVCVTEPEATFMSPGIHGLLLLF